ncbi:NUDIX domain-containing protein [Phyllobacterium sp. OV277]|uniref:NUDIX domain-containing protein n=1 Tax=Phyllobacterium sp. OV277 TaxID=1882772 RepID=UPI000883BFD2|nr:NUDIX domain-containing protein [Phyllobacterium sp. OV277]SDN79507.1 ADP-ribose pyrophosphatase YjhB, NUDIX family [Phyllobacterium sp. OV277]
MNAPGVGCGIVFLRDGHILLLQRKKSPEIGAWGIPGGKIDFLETAEQAIRREAFEETSLEAGSIRQLGLSEQLFHDERQHWFGVLFLAETFSGEMQLLEPDKHGGIDWFPLDNLPAKLTLPTMHALELIRQDA